MNKGCMEKNYQTCKNNAYARRQYWIVTRGLFMRRQIQCRLCYMRERVDTDTRGALWEVREELTGLYYKRERVDVHKKRKEEETSSFLQSRNVRV